MQVEWHTCFHEAGHAVIGRVVNQVMGYTTVNQDADSLGHSICAEPLETMEDWHKQGRFRDDDVVMHGRIMTFMAGVESEKLFFGFDLGGAGDDAWQITLMLDDIYGDEALEKRLRRGTKVLCLRHAHRIKLLAEALRNDGILQDDQIREIVGLPKPAHEAQGTHFRRNSIEPSSLLPKGWEKRLEQQAAERQRSSSRRSR